MYKVNLVKNDWSFISVVRIHALPRIGEVIYNREEGFYYEVQMVTHDVIKRRFWWDKIIISIIVKETKSNK